MGNGTHLNLDHKGRVKISQVGKGNFKLRNKDRLSAGMLDIYITDWG